MRKNTTILLMILAALPGFVRPAAAKEDALFTLADPRGDDYGAGGLVYPLRSDWRPGDLDIVSFSARSEKDGTVFGVTFANPIRKPIAEAIDQVGTQLNKVCRYGFYTFNLDLYVDTDRKPGSGSLNTLPGRIADIAPEDAWERAVVVTPRPFEARDELKRLVTADVRKEKKEQGERVRGSDLDALKKEIARDVENRVFFATEIHVQGPTIEFFVPESFLGGKASPSWGYVLGVSAADYKQSLEAVPTIGSKPIERGLMILAAEPGRDRDTVGGGDEDADGWQPAFLDVLVPTGRRQEKDLADYDPIKGRRAVLHAVVPSRDAPAAK